jgi:acyl-CoA synthetase (AMP-forming)/AMP-acid ligase II
VQGLPVIAAEGLWQLVERRAQATPEALFVVDEQDRELSFAGYRDAALRCAAGLHARGVGEGTAVSWMLPTGLEALVLVAALARLGARQNPILPIYRQREVGFVCRQSAARWLFVPRRFRDFDYEAMARQVAAEQPGLSPEVVDGALPEGDPGDLPPAPPPPASPEQAPVRWLFYTSGTTSDPKGALHTDATLLAPGRSLVRVIELAADDRIALVFPLSHIGGTAWLAASLFSGAGNIAVAAFDPATSIDLLARHGVTQGLAGTAFHQAYLAAQRQRQGSGKLFPHVRSFPGGGAPKPPELHYEIKRELGGAGVVSGYGLTEAPILVMNTVRCPDEKLAETEGRPCEGVRVRIVRMDGRPATPGQEGEIRVTGPQVCRGYLDAALDAEAFDADGFFRTGDLGRLDADGYLTITGRLKDVIIRKGENISAKEVEDLLYTHPKVNDVAVIGLPDPTRGERACAVVCCEASGEPLAFDEMVAFCKDAGLMVQKIPEQLELVEALPRNATGKVLKHELRQRYASR